MALFAAFCHAGATLWRGWPRWDARRAGIDLLARELSLAAGMDRAGSCAGCPQTLDADDSRHDRLTRIMANYSDSMKGCASLVDADNRRTLFQLVGVGYRPL